MHRIGGVLQQIRAEFPAQAIGFRYGLHTRYNTGIMLNFPAVDPVALHIEVRWYGLAYLAGILIGWLLLSRPRVRGTWSTEQVADLVFYTTLGVLVGGRVGSVLFYNTAVLWQEPLRILRIWEGGMSFHGGLLGVIVGLLWFCRRHGYTLQETADRLAPVVPVGLGLGRLGNFINGELWGTPSTLPWAMVFPHVDTLPRHPSQIYEFLLEGVLLLIILQWYASRPRLPWTCSGLFLLGYGCCRFLVEYTRAPDAHIGYLAWGWLTMGQLLSVPLLLAGGGLLIRAWYRAPR